MQCFHYICIVMGKFFSIQIALICFLAGFVSAGNKYRTLTYSYVGDVIGVAGDTFTSRNGSWIYTWNKRGDKINTRTAH